MQFPSCREAQAFTEERQAGAFRYGYRNAPVFSFSVPRCVIKVQKTRTACGKKKAKGKGSVEEKYVLATGDEGDYRLQIVDGVHGPDSRDLLRRAGLRPGLRVADIGCGVGMMTGWIAAQTGSTGAVVGVDVSAKQIEKARQREHAAGRANSFFVVASAYETELPSDSFDKIFSRFLLMHLARPADALREMHRLLKPGGTLVLEDGDFTTPFCDPPSAAYDRCFALYRLAGERQGADFRIGPQLPSLVQSAGFQDIAITEAQPVITEGDAKRLPEWTLEECAPHLVEAGLAAPEEIRALTTELHRLAAQAGTRFGMARVTQTIARK